MREKENMTHRDRDSDEAPLMRPNNSGIKKKAAVEEGLGEKRGKKTKIKQHNILREKNEQIRGDMLCLQIALSNVLKSFFSFLPEGVTKKTLGDHTLKIYTVLHRQTHLFLFSFPNKWRTLNDANNTLTFINIY